jgi:arylsulfatase A-like enzyme
MGAFEWELPEDLHSDVFVGDMAAWWVRTKPRPDGPLFLQVGFPGPHPPYDPIPRYATPYLERELPLPVVSEAELTAQPPPFLAMRQHNTEVDHDSIVHVLNPTRERAHRQRAYYLANVTMIDERIGLLLDALDDQGYLENSVVVFTSDHGDCLGDHGQSQKWTMYDSITRVPLIVWAPGRFEGGRRVQALCQLMDVGAAVLELAGVMPPEGAEAISLVPALAGQPWVGREYVFAEHGSDEHNFQGTEFMSMVRSERWKLVHFLDAAYGQLFDLRNDPKEVCNLWDDATLASTKRRLLDVLLEWRIRSGVRTRRVFAEWR